MPAAAAAAALLVALVAPAAAVITLPSHLSDGAVLQTWNRYHMAAKLYGRAEPGETITAYTSALPSANFTTTVDDGGGWMISYNWQASQAGVPPFELHLLGSSSPPVVLRGVVWGDVYVCLGEEGVMGIPLADAAGGMAWLTNASDPVPLSSLRLFPGIASQASDPAFDFSPTGSCTMARNASALACNAWQAATADGAAAFSALCLQTVVQLMRSTGGNPGNSVVGLVSLSAPGLPVDGLLPGAAVAQAAGCSSSSSSSSPGGRGQLPGGGGAEDVWDRATENGSHAGGVSTGATPPFPPADGGSAASARHSASRALSDAADGPFGGWYNGTVAPIVSQVWRALLLQQGTYSDNWMGSTIPPSEYGCKLAAALAALRAAQGVGDFPVVSVQLQDVLPPGMADPERSFAMRLAQAAASSPGGGSLNYTTSLVLESGGLSGEGAAAPPTPALGGSVASTGGSEASSVVPAWDVTDARDTLATATRAASALRYYAFWGFGAGYVGPSPGSVSFTGGPINPGSWELTVNLTFSGVNASATQGSASLLPPPASPGAMALIVCGSADTGDASVEVQTATGGPWRAVDYALAPVAASDGRGITGSPNRVSGARPTQGHPSLKDDSDRLIGDLDTWVPPTAHDAGGAPRMQLRVSGAGPSPVALRFGAAGGAASCMLVDTATGIPANPFLLLHIGGNAQPDRAGERVSAGRRHDRTSDGGMAEEGGAVRQDGTGAAARHLRVGVKEGRAPQAPAVAASPDSEALQAWQQLRLDEPLVPPDRWAAALGTGSQADAEGAGAAWSSYSAAVGTYLDAGRARTAAVASAVRATGLRHAPGILAPLPPLGWNSWQAFRCNVDEVLFKAQGDALVATGLAALGFASVNFDDCVQRSRLPNNGSLVPDETRFPSGMATLGTYLHARGLRFGMYTSATGETCVGRPAAYGHEGVDVATYCGWGVDFLKVDNCGGPRYPAVNTSWIKLRAGMEGCPASSPGAGPAMVLSVESCGDPTGCGSWIRASGAQLWRTTADLQLFWASVTANLDGNMAMAPVAGPGGWNDPDMLIVGHAGLSHDEARSHLSGWAVSAAPLLISTDLRALSQPDLGLLSNPEVVAGVDQDPAGVQGVRVSPAAPAGQECWARPLTPGAFPGWGGARGGSGGGRSDQYGAPTNATVVFLFNRAGTVANVSCTWAQLRIPPGTSAAVRDLWARAGLPDATEDAVTAVDVPPHGCALWLVTTPG